MALDSLIPQITSMAQVTPTATTDIATQPMGADLGVATTMPLTTTAAPLTTAADVAQQGLGSLGTNLPATTSAIPGGMDPTKSTEYTLSSWYAPYFTDYLAKQKALSELEYKPYEGQLTAGPSDLQTQAFQGIANLTAPERATMTSSEIGRAHV